MTCRSLLWIAAAAVSVGGATTTPSLVGAEQDAEWTVAIAAPAAEAVVESKHLTIEGMASDGVGVDGVTVTVVPQGLPPQCGPESGPAVVDGHSFAIEVEVGCNGPYEIQVVAESAGDSASGAPRLVGVAERPSQPAPPGLELTTEGGLRATWDPGSDPDADGTVLMVDFREDLFGRGIGEATLPPTDRRASVAVRALRWGAGGPGTTISSPESGGTYIGDSDPEEPDGANEAPPSGPPEVTPPLPPVDVPTGATPSPSSGGSTTPPPSISAPSTTSLAGRDEAQPRLARVAIWPDSARRPSAGTERPPVSTPSADGWVRASDTRTPGVMAPLALALLVICVAARVAWHSRRADP
jgi:hypothetical protein